MSIGVCVCTYNREAAFIKCMQALPMDRIDYLVIVKDGGAKYDCFKNGQVNLSYGCKTPTVMLDFVKNHGVSSAKNAGMAYLNQKKCEHVFIIEDDIIITDPNVFDVYIDAAKHSGIYHLNFSKIGHNPVLHSTSTIDLHEHCQGAFMYMYRGVINNIGDFDLGFKNAYEHIEWYYRCAVIGIVPPFWYFPDVKGSENFLEENTNAKTTISGIGNYEANVARSGEYFHAKWQKHVHEIPKISMQALIKDLYRLKATYSKP